MASWQNGSVTDNPIQDPAVPAAFDPGVVYVMDVEDRPGILRAIAAVFSERGLSIDALVAETHRTPSRILVLYQGGTARQCRLIRRVLQRLHDVRAVRMLPVSDPAIRAVAVCRAPDGWAPVVGIDAQPLGESWVLSGAFQVLDAALAKATREMRITDVFRSLVAI